MATVQNLAFPGIVDPSYISPNRRVAALPTLPAFNGEVILNLADNQMYIAATPVGMVPQGTDWAKYAYGLGLN
jgi:hypothetical protein